MLAKIQQYKDTWNNLPLKNSSKVLPTQFKFEWVDDIKQLQQVQRFRARQFSDQFGIQFDHGLDQDLYDFSCEHEVLKERWSGEIVAYTRLKCLQGYELATQSYSETEFAIADQFSHLSNIVEIGRTCVHPQFRSGRALSMLWLHLLPKVVWGMRAKHVMGCLSVRCKIIWRGLIIHINNCSSYQHHKLFIFNLKISLFHSALVLSLHKMKNSLNYLMHIFGCKQNFLSKPTMMKSLIA